MKNRNFLLLLTCLLILCNCQQQEQHDQKEAPPTREYAEPQPVNEADYLTRISIDSMYELGSPCGYVNLAGDTIIPIGKYLVCWDDTIKNFGIVYGESDSVGLIAIDPAGHLLYEVYRYDNGPDWVEDGLFRIIRNGKIGYADEDGMIKIKPQFACADQFSDGRARVALHCDLIPDGEHTLQKSEEWFYIDKAGEKVE